MRRQSAGFRIAALEWRVFCLLFCHISSLLLTTCGHGLVPSPAKIQPAPLQSVTTSANFSDYNAISWKESNYWNQPVQWFAGRKLAHSLSLNDTWLDITGTQTPYWSVVISSRKAFQIVSETQFSSNMKHKIYSFSAQESNNLNVGAHGDCTGFCLMLKTN